jgi:glyoxylase-like metal-dependent hydrolase (beta-lactamase superfamily II)
MGNLLFVTAQASFSIREEEMLKKGFGILAVLILFSSTGTPKDAGTVLDDVAQAMGATNLKTLQYSGIGFAYAYNQSWRPGEEYPKYYARYTRKLDFEKGISWEETIRTQFSKPPHGGGRAPIYHPAIDTVITSENNPAFNGQSLATQGNPSMFLPGTSWSGSVVLLTPHGFIKAAKAANATVTSKTVNGQPVSVISFTFKGKYKVNGYVNAQNLIEKVETWMSDAILGDTLIETNFSDYRDFNGVKFPMKIVQKEGVAPIVFPILEVTVKEVQPNAAVNIERPGTVPGPPPDIVEPQKIADGVWYLLGTPEPHSMAVEFKDYVVIIESSRTERRALANIAAVKKLVPNKPILYHLNTHHHSDHAAGLRTFIAEGSTIITHEMNKPYYEDIVLKMPHTLNPDRLSQNPKPAKFIYMKEKYVLTDGNRSLEIYWAHGAGHSDNLLMSYMPKEKILFITDIFNQWNEPHPNDPPPGIVSSYYGALGENIKRLKLDIAQIAPAHGMGVVPVAALNKALEGKVEPPAIVPIH